MKLTSTNAQELQYIRALVFGDTKIGKTTSIQTLLRRYPTGIVIAVGERGTLPLREYDIPVFPIESWPDILALTKAVRAPESIKDKAKQSVIKDCKVLIIDSLCEVSDLCLRYIVDVERRQLVKERTDGRRDTPQNVYDSLMQWEDWNLYATKMLNLVSALTHLPVHIICTARTRWTQDTSGGDKQCMPNMAGQKVPPELPSRFDLVLYMEAAKNDEGEPIRRWRTFNDGQIYAGDCSHALDPFEETDWSKLFDKILETEVTK